MKRLVFVIFSLFILGRLSFAQNPFDYDIVQTEGYEGMWLYQSNDTVFKLQLVRMDTQKYGKFRSFVGGLYSISIGGKELQSTLHREYDHLSTSVCTPNEIRRVFRIIARNHRTEDMKVDYSYLDFTICLPRDFLGTRTAFFLSTNTLKLIAPDKLEWKITENPTYVLEIKDEKPIGNPPSFAYPLPAHVILTKVTEW